MERDDLGDLWVGRHRGSDLVVTKKPLYKGGPVLTLWFLNGLTTVDFERETELRFLRELTAEELETFRGELEAFSGEIRKCFPRPVEERTPQSWPSAADGNVAEGPEAEASPGQYPGFHTDAGTPSADWSEDAEVDKEAIRRFVLTRGIRTLVHFTRLENVRSILERGLVPRSILETQGIPAIFNDMSRWDGHLDSVSLSIEFPNYQMFFKYRMRGGEWALCGIRPEVLWSRCCAFYPENAASGRSKQTKVHQARSATALESMFGETAQASLGVVTREQLRLRPSHPTNPQAEVLVFETIPPEEISFLAVESVSMGAKLKVACGSLLKEHLYRLEADYFRRRVDWKYWWRPESAVTSGRDPDAEPGDDIPF